MADRLEATLDHVAIAVPDWKVAEQRWRNELGGARSSAGENSTFGARQLQFRNGAKLELLTPAGTAPDNFVRRFLGRFGATIHHVTLKVGDLHAAIGVLQGAGLDVVDVNDDSEYWKEGFLRPSQVGGLVVQVAQTSMTDDDWAAFTGFTRERPGTDAADLIGPLLHHPRLDEAGRLWDLLGADVSATAGGLRCAWPDSALQVLIRHGEPAGPASLVMANASALTADPGVGPAVVV